MRKVKGLSLLRLLSNAGYKGFYSDVHCDPVGPDGFEFEADINKIITKSSCLVIMTEHKEYFGIQEILAKDNILEKTIIDPWRMFDGRAFDENTHTYPQARVKVSFYDFSYFVCSAGMTTMAIIYTREPP